MMLDDTRANVSVYKNSCTDRNMAAQVSCSDVTLVTLEIELKSILAFQHNIIV